MSNVQVAVTQTATIVLEKTDLVALVRGFDPTYEQMGDSLVAKNGDYRGSYDRWVWRTNDLRELSFEELIVLFKFLRNK